MPEHASCPYRLHGIMNHESARLGQHRTSEACFIISLPTDVLSLLLLFQLCELSGLEVHHDQEVEEQWARRGWVGRKQERRGALVTINVRGMRQTQHTKMCSFHLHPSVSTKRTLPGVTARLESRSRGYLKLYP